MRALAQAMVYNDPVVYDWQHLKPRTLELGGDKDGPDFAERAKYICDTIPNCQLELLRVSVTYRMPRRLIAFTRRC